MVTCRRGNQFREGVEAFHVTRSSINRVILIIILFVNGPENGARAEPKPPRASLDALLALIPHQTRMDHSVRVDLEELRKGLRSKDHRTRSHAANRAAQLGPKAEPLVPSLFEAYVAEPIPYVAEEIRRALVSVGKGAVSPTAKVLRDQRKGSKARFFALQLLEDLQFDINVTDPAMREVVKDQDKTIAFHAAQFLVKPGLLQSKESWERITLCMESSVSGEPQMSDDLFLTPGTEREPFHGPVDRRAQGLGQDRPTGFANGRQLPVRPFIRMALPQLTHQEAVRQHDEVRVPGLALTVTQLTIPQAQLLLAIPMKGLRACPATPIHTHDACDFPLHPVGHQDDARLGVLPLRPEQDDPYLVADVRNAQRAGEVPLLLVALTQQLAHAGIDLGRQLGSLLPLALVLQLAVELQGADVATGSAVA